MTLDAIKSAICAWITSLGFVAVKSPTNHPSPEGEFYAVSTGLITGIGTEEKPKPGTSGKGAFHNLVSVQIYEVEGTGDGIAKIRSSLLTDEFTAFIDARFENADDRISVWEINDIQEVSSMDGPYTILQRTFTFDVEYIDRPLEEKSVSEIRKVEGTINGETLTVERSID